MARSAAPPTEFAIDPRQEFGQRLREVRRRQQLTQEQVAERGRLDFTFVSACERGRRNASLISIYRLARGLGVPPWVLLQPPGVDE